MSALKNNAGYAPRAILRSWAGLPLQKPSGAQARSVVARRRKTPGDSQSPKPPRRRHKSDDGNTVATFFNTAPMSEKLGFDALQASLNAQAEDMTIYATNRLAKIFNQVGKN